MINNLSAYSFTNNDVLTLYGLASGALTTGTLDPQTQQTRDGGYLPPPVSVVYTPRPIDGEDFLVFDNYLCEGSSVSVNLSTTSTCVNLATGYDLFNFGYQLLIEEKGQVLDRVDTFNYNNTFNIVCSASLVSNWEILSGTATYNKEATALSGTGIDLLPVGTYINTDWPYDTLTVKYYLPIEESAPIFWPNELLNVYKTKKIIWDMFSIRLGGEDLKGDYIPLKQSERTYIVDQARNLTQYNPLELLYNDQDFSLSAVQLGNTISGNTGPFGATERLGQSVDINDDGTRIVVGALPTGIIGGVRVYELIDSAWVKIGQDIIEVNNFTQNYPVSMNGTGNRIAVGDRRSTGGGDDRGITRVFEWSGSDWIQLGGNIVGEQYGDWSGDSIQLNSVGDRIVIGERYGDAGGYESGQVRVYQYNGSMWVQMGEVIAGGAELDGVTSTAINSTGDIIIYGSAGANLPVLGYSNVGVVRAYMWNGSQWNQIGQDIYGDSDFYLVGLYGLSINSIGDILAVTGVQFGGNNIVRVYKYDGTSWNQINAFYGTETTYTYGYSISLNSEGDRIAIGDRQRFSYNRGAVDVYEYNGMDWEKIIVDIEGPNNGTGSSFFGESVALNKNGDRLVVGAPVISGGQVRTYQLPQYPLIALSAFIPYKSTLLWSDGYITENYFTSPFYLPDGTLGSSSGVINYRNFTAPGEYTIINNTFYYKNSLNFQRVLTEPYNITFVVS